STKYRVPDTGLSAYHDATEREEANNDGDLNRMKCLDDMNRAAVGTRANVSDEPGQISVATADDWCEPKLARGNRPNEVETPNERAEPWLTCACAFTQSLGDNRWRMWRADLRHTIWHKEHRRRVRPNETQDQRPRAP